MTEGFRWVSIIVICDMPVVTQIICTKFFRRYGPDGFNDLGNHCTHSLGFSKDNLLKMLLSQNIDCTS